MNILFLSHTYIGCNYVVGSHHLSKALAELGHQVVHIPHPWSTVHKIVRGTRADFVKGQLSPNRWQFQIGGFLPSKWHMLALDFDSHSQRLAEEISLHCSDIDINNFEYCFVDDPVFHKTCEYLPIGKLIYRPTDIYPKMPQGRAYKKADKQLVECSNSVIATSAQILKYHGIEALSNTFVLNNGFDMALFLRHNLQVHDDQNKHVPQKQETAKSILSVCYIGALDKRFDFDLINSAAQACKEVDFDIYSPSDPGKLERGLKNLHCLGALDYQQLPSTLAKYDLLLMPFTFALSNHGRSPMKLFEYAASNVPILAPSYMNTFGIEDVTQYSNLEEFIVAIKNARINPILKRDMDTLKLHSWALKAEQLLQLADGKAL